jgi:glycine oxidase
MSQDTYVENSLPSSVDVAIVGGGIIGLSIAWQLARAGVETVVVEKNTVGRAASWAAAGMLAPLAEVGFEELEFLKLGRESLAMYPTFLAELEVDSGAAVPLDRRGTLMVSLDRDDTAELRRLFEFRKKLSLPVRWLSGAEARDEEPLLSPKVAAAIDLPDDYQIDNRELLVALEQAVLKCGGKLCEHTSVEKIIVESGRAVALQLDGEEQRQISAAKIVVAAGCWSSLIGGLAKDKLPPVRPVKGQILTLRMTTDIALTKVVRSPRVYLAPKFDGRLVVGATSEEMGFDTAPTAGAQLFLLEEAFDAVPAVYELALEEMRVGLRPASRDNEPLIGESPIAQLYYATGHYRHGILLAPATSYAMAAMLTGKKVPEALAPFSPSRFFNVTRFSTALTT